MPAKRTTELPLGDGYFDYFFWNPFFDEGVQSVLMTRKTPNLNARKSISKNPQTDNWLLAWPIKAYEEITYLTYDFPKYWNENNFGTFYGWDPEFIADLLQALTAYKNEPEANWNLSRALAECPRRGHAVTKYKNSEDLRRATARFPSLEKQSYFLRFVNECQAGGFEISNEHRIMLGDCPPEGLPTERLFDFTEMRKIISDNFPHLRHKLDVADTKRDGKKRKTTPTDKLRTYFERLVKLRQRKEGEWKPNFSAADRILIPDDLTQLPCVPGPDYYS